MKVSRENKLREAKEAQALVECKACFDDECLPEEILPCKNGHDFCFDCIRRASEVSGCDIYSLLSLFIMA